jgi:hypothetical protein
MKPAFAGQAPHGMQRMSSLCFQITFLCKVQHKKS